jgi:hypothetical protein
MLNACGMTVETGDKGQPRRPAREIRYDQTMTALTPPVEQQRR